MVGAKQRGIVAWDFVSPQRLFKYSWIALWLNPAGILPDINLEMSVDIALPGMPLNSG
jgi:hypothetical protein